MSLQRLIFEKNLSRGGEIQLLFVHRLKLLWLCGLKTNKYLQNRSIINYGIFQKSGNDQKNSRQTLRLIFG